VFLNILISIITLTVVLLAEARYALNTEGTLITYSDSASAWVAIPALSQVKFKRLMAPFCCSQQAISF
jgi:hypothetical protein